VREWIFPQKKFPEISRTPKKYFPDFFLAANNYRPEFFCGFLSCCPSNSHNSAHARIALFRSWGKTAIRDNTAPIHRIPSLAVHPLSRSDSPKPQRCEKTRVPRVVMPGSASL